MGRITTAAIITLALAGATVQSFAGELPKGPTLPDQAKGGTPVEQLLADVTAPPPPAPSADPGAEPPPPPPGPMGHMPPGMGPQGMMDGMGPHPGPWAMGPMHHMERSWGLFFDQHDKKLSAADVQTLAQAVLLVHGNHSWKVTNVTPDSDGNITFDYTTADGSVIARFAVDPHSGRMTRIG